MSSEQIKQFHNQVISLARHQMGKGMSVAELILVLEMIKQDLVKQVLDSSYKQPVTIKENGRIQKDTS